MNRKNNRHLNYKNEKGAISLFVVLSMLFFIVFVVGSYTMISRKSQQQAESNAELKNAYVRDGQEQYDALVNNSSTEIPIKNKQDLYKIGTGAEIVDTSTGFSYIATPEATYSIKSTITIPMEEIAGFKGDATDDYRFKDYVVYGDAKPDDTNEYKVTYEPGTDIVYTLNGEFYKLLIYSASGNKTAPYNGYSYIENEYYIYKDTVTYSAEPHEYLLYLSEADGTFNELKADTNFFAHDAYGGIPNSTSINGIGNLKKAYFLFVKYEKSSAVIGKYLSDVVNVGDYVNYRLDYSSLINNPTATDAKTGWRVVSKEYDKTKETYIIKLISEGAPLKFSVKGENTSNDITNFDKAVYDNFESTTFSSENGKSVTGNFFKNAYADNVQSLDYKTLSLAITEDPSIDYINKKGGIGNTDIREYEGNVLKGYAYNESEQKITKKGLLDIDKSYWIGKVSTNTNDVHFVKYETSNTANKITKLGNGTTSTYGIRPVVTLIDNLIVIANDDGTAGTGTKENPYNIKIENKHASGPSVGDYVVYTSNTTTKYNYTNVNVKRDDGYSYKSELTGWRILDIADDGTVRLISAGVPLLYNLKDNKGQDKTQVTIQSELGDNFTKTNFITSTGTTVLGDFLLNPEYASEISTLSYEDLSYSVYDNPDYITVSENEKWAETEGELFTKNTIADANFKRVINDWTNKKNNLFTVGTDYIITMKDGSKAFVYQNQEEGQEDNACLTTRNDWGGSGGDKIGLRIVVTLKKTTKFLTGTGTKIDPYVLSGTASADVTPFRIGDYVTYSGIPTYSNVSSLSNSSGKTINQTGWRVVSYKKEGTTSTLKLISAGIPYYTTAFNMPGISGKDYATHIKSFAYNTIEIKDAAGNRVDDKSVLTVKSDKIQTVESFDYDQYCNFIKLYNSREVSKDLLYLNQYYWLGSYYEHKEREVVSYRLRYVSLTSDSSLLEQKTYGIRPVITLKSGFTVEEHSGTASDPHVLIFK